MYDTQLVEMLSTKCGQQTALVDDYKLEVERQKSNCSKQKEVAEQLESLRWVNCASQLQERLLSLANSCKGTDCVVSVERFHGLTPPRRLCFSSVCLSASKITRRVINIDGIFVRGR